MRGRVLAFVAAVLVTTGLAAGTARAADGPPPPIGARVGVNPGSVILWESDADRQDDLDAIVASGAHWTSIDVDWNSIQPDGPASFDWTVTDRVVREAHVRGLAIVGMVAYAPPWARPESCPSGTSHCLPAHPEDYARFAKAAALRYGANAFDESLRGSIGTWQIWNEPNHFPFVQPRVDVGRYTEMLRRTYAEIKKVDAGSLVLAGGTAPAPDDPKGRDMAPVTFLEGVYAHGGGGSFDGFAHHPYSYPCNPLINKQWNAFFQTYWLHQALTRHGDGERKIWGTESGAPTGGDVGACGAHDGVSVSEQGQAQIALDALRGWTQPFGRFTGPLLWYQIRDTSTDPSQTEDHFGLLRHDATPKPAARVFADYLAGPDLTVGSLTPGPPPVPVPDPPPAPAPDPTPPPTVDPPPVVDPPPAVDGECDTAGASVVLTGAQSDRATPVFDTASTVDARTARWTQVDPWPVSVTGDGPVCWSGGVIAGTYPVSTPWSTFHSTGAFNITNPDSVIENLRVHDYGDGIRLRQGARGWRVRGAYETYIHDDCVEDDKLHAGVITDSLFDGCYVGISTRPTDADTTSDGHANTLVLDGSLLRLQPMPTVYKGDAPGHGGFFKWDTYGGRSPRLVVRNDVLRVDQPPNHGSLGLPDGYDVECSGNTIVWLGDGPFPGAASWRAACPDTRIVTDRAVWDRAVAAWHAAHGR